VSAARTSDGATIEHAEPSGEQRARTRRRLVAILLLALALRLFGFTESWSGVGFRSAFATVTTGCNARNFAEHGLWASKLMPYYWRVELADGSALYEYYAHHPALFAVVGGLSLELFGAREWALTLPYLVFSLLSVVAVWRLAREWWGEREAHVAGLFLAVVPLSAWYGTLAWIDGLTITFHALAILYWLRWMRGGGHAQLVRGALAMFGAGLCDWTGALLLPGLGLFALAWAWKRGSKHLLPALLYPAGCAAAALVHWLHMRAVLPPELAHGDTRNTLSWVAQLPSDGWGFLAQQARHQLKLLTWPGVVVLGAAWLWQAARLVRGRACFEQGLLFALFPPGLLYIALVPSRSINHEFFSFVSLPWMALSCAWLLSSVLGWKARVASGATARATPLWARLALLGFASVCAWRTAEIWQAERRAGLGKLVHSAWLAPLLEDPRAVIVASPNAGLALPFYTRAPLIPGIASVEQLEELRARVLSRVGPGRRIVFLFDLLGAEIYAPLRQFLGAHATAIPRLELIGERPPIGFEEYDLSEWAAAR
jgi:4-amino-4-deoxy-L-arabinose transferase-like glycosyltransferase